MARLWDGTEGVCCEVEASEMEEGQGHSLEKTESLA